VAHSTRKLDFSFGVEEVRRETRRGIFKLWWWNMYIGMGHWMWGCDHLYTYLGPFSVFGWIGLHFGERLIPLLKNENMGIEASRFDHAMTGLSTPTSNFAEI
jgi:hypothetical protein